MQKALFGIKIRQALQGCQNIAPLRNFNCQGFKMLPVKTLFGRQGKLAIFIHIHR
jgi:hypothetical protein